MTTNKTNIKIVKGTPYDSPNAPSVWLFTGAPLETRELFHGVNKRWLSERDSLKRCHWSRPRTAWYTHDPETVKTMKELLGLRGYTCV